ncbi:MAG: sulfite exporter TauE/SafE family protein [Clostridia bacterium]|nr:sulfite exporter TauE/SafE family protein [Clostridia bacterium]MBR2327122.1 sulfite exporter TauE/SafE family protein [Clostridia bacterium]
MNYIIGFLSGIAASMGLGGGSVLLVWLTGFAGVAPSEAAGINLLFFLPTAVLSVILNAKNRLVDFKTGFLIALSSLPGAIVGGLLAVWIGKSDAATVIFAVFLFAIGIKELFFTKSTKKQTE